MTPTDDTQTQTATTDAGLSPMNSDDDAGVSMPAPVDQLAELRASMEGVDENTLHVGTLARIVVATARLVLSQDC